MSPIAGTDPTTSPLVRHRLQSDSSAIAFRYQVNKMLRILAVIAAFALTGISNQALAQFYPVNPVRLVQESTAKLD